MEVNIIIFGQLTDILNSNKLTLSGITDTNQLIRELSKQYPALVEARYMMAVDKQTVTENVLLKDGSTVALMPPFSGG